MFYCCFAEEYTQTHTHTHIHTYIHTKQRFWKYLCWLISEGCAGQLPSLYGSSTPGQGNPWPILFGMAQNWNGYPTSPSTGPYHDWKCPKKGVKVTNCLSVVKNIDICKFCKCHITFTLRIFSMSYLTNFVKKKSIFCSKMFFFWKKISSSSTP